MAVNGINALALFKALGDESRLHIVQILLQGESYVELIASRLGLTSATVSHHLKKLEEAGLVECHRTQFYMIYSLNREIFDKPLFELIKKDEEIVDTEEKYKKEVISNFFKYGRLTQIPTQRKKREIVLAEILKQFDVDREYGEKEVNEVILRYHEDYCTIRREMIAFGMMTRDHERYKRVK